MSYRHDEVRQLVPDRNGQEIDRHRRRLLPENNDDDTDFHQDDVRRAGSYYCHPNGVCCTSHDDNQRWNLHDDRIYRHGGSDRASSETGCTFDHVDRSDCAEAFGCRRCNWRDDGADSSSRSDDSITDDSAGTGIDNATELGETGADRRRRARGDPGHGAGDQTMMSSVNLRGLGDARSDLVGVLASFMGRDKAEAWMKSLETLIQKKAQEGAVKGIKPLAIGAIAVGGVAVLLSVVAIARARRRP